MTTREKIQMLEDADLVRRKNIIEDAMNCEKDMLSGFNKPVNNINVEAEVIKPTDKAAERKATPVFSGFLAYFADAVNEVSRCSMAGQKQHAPDEPLQWHRDKSGDELDALSRHLLEAGTMDDDSIRHSTKIAWRAMANLQKELELAGEAPLSKYNKI